MTEWLTGSGEIISFQEVLNRVVDHSLLNGVINIEILIPYKRAYIGA